MIRRAAIAATLALTLAPAVLAAPAHASWPTGITGAAQTKAVTMPGGPTAPGAPPPGTPGRRPCPARCRAAG